MLKVGDLVVYSFAVNFGQGLHWRVTSEQMKDVGQTFNWTPVRAVVSHG